MCTICVDWQAGKMTTREAIRNLQEVSDTMDEGHFWEVFDKLAEEDPANFTSELLKGIP